MSVNINSFECLKKSFKCRPPKQQQCYNWKKKELSKKCNLNLNYVQLNQNFHVVGRNKNYSKLKFLRQLIEIIKVLPTSSTGDDVHYSFISWMSIVLTFHSFKCPLMYLRTEHFPAACVHSIKRTCIEHGMPFHIHSDLLSRVQKHVHVLVFAWVTH